MGGHRKAHLHHRIRRAISAVMAAVTTGGWVPFASGVVHESDQPSQPPDEVAIVPAPIFEPHAPPTWPEKQVPRPVNLTKHHKKVHNPATDPTYSKPTPKVPVSIKPPVVHHQPPPPPSISKTEILLTFVRAQLGKSYVLGGSGPDVWDCSGLTEAAYARVGIYLPRTSQSQSLVGFRIPLSEMRAGDLVFWGVAGAAFHVGIYMGHGEIIAAQNPASGVISFTVSYYTPSFARRVL